MTNKRTFASSTARRLQNRQTALRKDPTALTYVDHGNRCRNDHESPRRYLSNDNCVDCIRQRGQIWKSHLTTAGLIGEAERVILEQAGI